MMEVQPTGMNPINYKKDHFDEIHKKVNAEESEFPSIAIALI